MVSFLIIVPTLNSWNLLPQLINSLRQQTFLHWRVRFIDGPSEQSHRDYLEDICSLDSRFQWECQLSQETGIFGAMNEGMKFVDLDRDWVLFWGSDDQASSPLMLENIAKKLNLYELQNNLPDLLICHGTYYQRDMDPCKKKHKIFGRKTKFTYRRSFRRSLFCGSTPPHQATFFGRGALVALPHFTPELRLSADLDYFLRLSMNPKISIRVEDIEVVWIGNSGISQQETKNKLKEVRISYKRAFGSQWWIPFLLRYLQRLQSWLEAR
ncbi:MAG: glycosyltransferase [Cyanobacteriota bacterium]|jgi:glycosyltransferase involved in cell wall biosynthesis